MRHNDVRSLLTPALLRFIRDERPTAAHFVARYGGTAGQVYHLLRKAGVLVTEVDHLALHRNHLSSDGRSFLWGNSLFSLDTDMISTICFGPRGKEIR